MWEDFRNWLRVPKCSQVIVGKHELVDNMIPLVHKFKALTGTKKAICPVCGFKGNYPADFNVVLNYESKTTINYPDWKSNLQKSIVPIVEYGFD